MEVALILAMHGMPPRDFPKAEMAEYFRQYDPFHHGGAPSAHSHGKRDAAAPAHGHALNGRIAELEHKMRHWPRNPQNDSFYGAAYRLADCLKQASGYPVFVGFNEFCAPDLEEAFAQAIGQGADTVMVITPMMTPGGIHSEVDIPQTIQRARGQYPSVRFEYVWPFQLEDVASFLKGQIAQRLA